MASLTAKVVHGHKYFQIITSRRINGKPRQVVLAHLGTADTLFARLQQKQGEPIKARVQPFGFLAAAWGLAQKLQLVSLIDRHVPKRQQGASVGQYLVLAALSRLTSLNSKARMAQWYRKTPLQRWLPLSAKQLRSQRFWDAMNAVDESAIRKIEMQLSRQLVEDFGIDVRCLCFDCTNFDTFIDSRTTSELARRGHAKSKRTDLRVVGLALLVSTDFNIPLFSRVYPGNQPDSVTFGSVTQELIERYRVLAKNLEHVTLVFDKGNNSEENLEALGPSPYHVVGSLVPTQHPDLLEVPLDKFQSFQDARLEGVTAFRTSKKVFGRHWTIVATHSQELLEGQLRGIAQVLGKRRRGFRRTAGETQAEPRARGQGEGLHLREPGSPRPESFLRPIHPEDPAGRNRAAARKAPVALPHRCAGLGEAHRHLLGKKNSVHRQPPVDDRGDHSGVPQSASCGGCLPHHEGSPLRGLGASLSLDRSKNPCPCFLLRAGPDSGWAVAPRSPPRRPGAQSRRPLSGTLFDLRNHQSLSLDFEEEGGPSSRLHHVH